MKVLKIRSYLLSSPTSSCIRKVRKRFKVCWSENEYFAICKFHQKVCSSSTFASDPSKWKMYHSSDNRPCPPRKTECFQVQSHSEGTSCLPSESRFTNHLHFQDYDKTTTSVWKWIQLGARNCTNCVLVPTKHLFCDKDSCPFVDPATKLARYCDCNHVTPRESLKLIPDLVKAINDEGQNK